MSSATCDLCGRPAVYHQAYSGRHLCGRCLVDYVERAVKRAISRYSMFRPGDRIAVAVSGGKDSMSLLHILSRLAPRHRSEVVAVTIDVGGGEYWRAGVELARSFTQRLGVEHRVFSYRELYGVDLEEIARRIGPDRSACGACGPLRRRALDIAAKEVDADVLATGHNLDDFLETFLINLVQGDLKRVAWALEGEWRPLNGRVRRVQPLVELYGEEILAYAKAAGIPFQGGACPFRRDALRLAARAFLRSLESRSPGAKRIMFRSAMKIAEALKGESYSSPEVRPCRICGWPSTSEVCNVCSTLMSLGLEPPASYKYEDIRDRPEARGGPRG